MEPANATRPETETDQVREYECELLRHVSPAKLTMWCGSSCVYVSCVCVYVRVRVRVHVFQFELVRNVLKQVIDKHSNPQTLLHVLTRALSKEGNNGLHYIPVTRTLLPHTISPTSITLTRSPHLSLPFTRAHSI